MKNIKILKNYIVFSTGFFIFSAFSGFLFAQSNPAWAEESMQILLKQFQSLIHPNPLIQFLIIFSHNAFAALLSLLLFFMFGAAALFSIFSNGMIVGLVLNVYSKQVGLFSVLLLLLPHGIIELPVFFLSSALGIWLGFMFAKSLSRKHSFKDSFYYAVKIYLYLIIPLLFVSALIETFITPWIFSLFK